MSPQDHGAGDLVFVGDVHLDREDPALPAFLRFLGKLEARADRVVLAGDLFQVWLGRRELEMPHQTPVCAALRSLRARGVCIRYLEGNRDFHIRRAYAGDVVDDATDRGIVEQFGGRSLFAIHGDLANRADRRYRSWRRISRSRLVWAAFNLLPRHRRLRLALSLEERLRASNPEFKAAFPEEAVRAYAAQWFAQGHDTVVLGHFHVERDLAGGPHFPGCRILVLPEWRESRRHLRVRPDGEVSFVDSE